MDTCNKLPSNFYKCRLNLESRVHCNLTKERSPYMLTAVQLQNQCLRFVFLDFLLSSNFICFVGLAHIDLLVFIFLILCSNFKNNTKIHCVKCLSYGMQFDNSSMIHCFALILAYGFCCFPFSL